MKNKQDAAKLRQKWAEAHVGPIEKECEHDLVRSTNRGIVMDRCTKCNARRLA